MFYRQKPRSFPRPLGGLLLAVTIAAIPFNGQADWKDWLQDALREPSTGSSSAIGAVLSNQDVIDGLKQALQNGVAHAVQLLGREDGFLGDPKVRIPIPDSVQPVADTLRRFGQGALVDEFQSTLNRAAEAAVPEGRQILVDAVSGMTIEDARNILNGPDNAATEFFRRASGERLHQRILPIIGDATTQAGVTSAYKNLTGQVGSLAGMLGMEVPDLDDYVADKALDGLFLMIAEEEKRIRENPAARTSELLKKVFNR